MTVAEKMRSEVTKEEIEETIRILTAEDEKKKAKEAAKAAKAAKAKKAEG